MNETTQQQELSGLERFSHLEDKLFRLVEEFKTIRKENETLRTENQKLKQEISELQGHTSKTQDDLAQFQKEREELKGRVEKALTLLASLEARETA